MSVKDFQFPRLEKKWKVLAFESEMISKEILSNEFLPEELYRSYSKKISRLKLKLAKQSKSSMKKHFEEKFDQIEAQLKLLNSEKRIQTNFEFFTRKIHYFKNRLDFLHQSLECFDKRYYNLVTIQCKRAQIEEEIASLEKSMVDVQRKREELLA